MVLPAAAERGQVEGAPPLVPSEDLTEQALESQDSPPDYILSLPWGGRVGV